MATGEDASGDGSGDAEMGGVTDWAGVSSLFGASATSVREDLSRSPFIKSRRVGIIQGSGILAGLTAVDKEQREAQREAVKTLAIAVGVREAARQLGLNEDRVRQWSSRGKWFMTEPKPQPPTVTRNDVTTVTKPSQALSDMLNDDNEQTKLSLSKGIRKAAEHIKGQAGSTLFKSAKNMKEVVGAASQLHQWEAKSDVHQDIHIGVMATQAMVFQEGNGGA